MAEMARVLGIEKTNTTPYHTQAAMARWKDSTGHFKKMLRLVLERPLHHVAQSSECGG